MTAPFEEPQRPIRYRDASPQRRRRLWLIAPFAVLIVLVVLAVVIGIAVRAYAEKSIADQVEKSFPTGVTGDVDVRLGGLFLLGQYLSGRMDDVRLTSDDLSVQSVPVRARLNLTGAPVDLTKPVDHVAGSVLLDERAIQAILEAQGYTGTAAISDGKITYTDSTRLLGATIEYEITARPSLHGGRLELVPVSAAVRSGKLNLDASALLRLVAPDGISVCLAEYVPDTIDLDSLRISGGSVRATFSGDDVVLTEEALARHGSCS